MTIAAGFRFDKGILLCADTQLTSASKTQATKIFTIQHQGATVILVLTGRQTYAVRAVEQITNQIKRLPENQLTKNHIQDGIEIALRPIFQNDVYTHPDWGKEESPDFSFVGGLHSPIDGSALIATEETITYEVKDHVCLGSGAYLGDYLSRMYLGREQSLEDVSALAAYILFEAKSFDTNCGGASEFVVLAESGNTSRIETLDITLAEDYAPAFNQATTKIFYAMANLDRADEQVHKDIVKADEILFLNQLARKDKKHQYSLAELLERSLSDALKMSDDVNVDLRSGRSES